MGIHQFLAEISPSAGRRVELSAFAGGILPVNGDTRRPLRIGVDVSSWIFKACMGFSDMLADERHLSNYGRASLHNFQVEGNAEPVLPAQDEEQVKKYVIACTSFVVDRLLKVKQASEGDILVVLDGATPPVKASESKGRADKRKEQERLRDEDVDPTGDEQAQEKRIKAFRRAGAGKHYFDIIADIIQALRQNQIPFLVSPYESDGQLAYLANKGYIDLVITEDTDMIAYGVSPILYKLTDSVMSGAPSGILIRRDDLTAHQKKLDLIDFSTTMMAVLFVCVGSDYCKKLKGIGIVAANNIVRAAFLQDNKGKAPLEVVFERLFSETWDKNLSEKDKASFRSQFLAALLMFRHPVVFDPVERKCIRVGFPDRGVDLELASYKAYLDLCLSEELASRVTGPVLGPKLATYIAEGWLSPRTKRAYEVDQLPPHVREFVHSEADQAAGSPVKATGTPKRPPSPGETGQSPMMKRPVVEPEQEDADMALEGDNAAAEEDEEDLVLETQAY